MEFWEEIANAVKIIKELGVNRLDGNNYSVYRVGKIIRIDLSFKENDKLS